MASGARYVQKLASMRDTTRAGWDQLTDEFARLASAAAVYVPEGVEYASTLVGQVPVESFTPPSAQGAVLLVHGGNFLLPTVDAYRTFAQRVAIASGRKVVLADYCLLPYDILDALAEVYGVWEWLYAQDDRLCLLGDGSGANMALLLAQGLVSEGRHIPRGIALLSPQTDMTCSGHSYYDNYYLDVVYGRRHLGGADIPEAFMASPMWAYLHGLSPDSPDVSPLWAEMAGLPPCLVTVGSHEVVLDDARRFAVKASAAGVDVRLLVGEGLFYAYPMMVDRFDEAQAAFDEIAAFLRAH